MRQRNACHRTTDSERTNDIRGPNSASTPSKRAYTVQVGDVVLGVSVWRKKKTGWNQICPSLTLRFLIPMRGSGKRVWRQSRAARVLSTPGFLSMLAVGSVQVRRNLTAASIFAQRARKIRRCCFWGFFHHPNPPFPKMLQPNNRATRSVWSRGDWALRQPRGRTHLAAFTLQPRRSSAVQFNVRY